MASKKRKYFADGVFFAELNEVLKREHHEDGYSYSKYSRYKLLGGGLAVHRAYYGVLRFVMESGVDDCEVIDYQWKA
ncbi:hypothetical protein MKW98_001439 [Papaver atlanticum]|uniref:Uncharacterized protein n=1 Tax=Papaver atlanticum TaxID=357466 RepID=A0AAD4SXT4_9MAGN|nr:hypothetical protein MKW98_001439 [Papaver atlanticum]